MTHRWLQVLTDSFLFRVWLISPTGGKCMKLSSNRTLLALGGLVAAGAGVVRAFIVQQRAMLAERKQDEIALQTMEGEGGICCS
jgi:hypothetical protein